MERQIAFLRGVNISGKNKVPMKELKKGCEQLGFREVKTYLNSGNVIFSGEEEEEAAAERIASMLKEQFGLDIPVLVLSKEKLTDILRHAPQWWGSGGKEIYDNLIFLFPPATFSQVLHEIGEPREGLERIENYQEAIFWSFSRKDYRKTNWWPKTAGAGIAQKLTIRTANTVKRIVEGM